MTYPIYGGPIGLSANSDLQQNFLWMYGACNAAQNLSPSCTWQDFRTQLNINPAWATANGEGILLIYMIENDGSADYFSYAIVNATRDSSGYFEPSPGAVHFSILPGGGIKTYTTSAELLYMAGCVAAYEATIMIRNFNDIVSGTPIPIITLPNHPKKAFFSAETVWKFYDDNNAQVSNSTDVILCNGAEFTEIMPTPPADQFKAQTPILIFSNSGVKLLSDTTADWTKPFQDKAMDKGAKCPPLCS